ncbi:hypothetical protein BDN70DRAFT_871562 [Pholiota conissans]|uniref:C2 domain-containing protein n=1 Tax=Pholiota conissans TaxID=109636 RepID=A0A9P5ZCZ9_9AGAR|nr:hypothetical protein BDN70DRAFT_871562 [Pholiota conissans]
MSKQLLLSNIPIPEHGKTKANEREVTDPITHLPLTIHDTDAVELEKIPPPHTAAEEKKLNEQRGADSKEESNARHFDMEHAVQEMLDANWWEDPIGDQRRARVQTSTVAATAAAVGAFFMMLLWSFFARLFGGKTYGIGVLGFLLLPFVCCTLGLMVGLAGMSMVLYQKNTKEYANELKEGPINTKTSPYLSTKPENAPESAHWLNSFLNSVWPIVNPSLFIAVADMLEDTMQATLPKLVYGVRVADIGQGSESIRILGIRLLDAGSAGKDVNGMKAEEGDFVNMELAIAYRAKETTISGMRGRSANAHLLVEFWVAGGMAIPVWVELTGFLASVRVRFQLTPNPPFLSLMTVTLLGLPKVTLKCTPLAKNFLNVMDVPGLSHWIQRSINLAVEEYVAPRSLTIDLKTLLMGRPKMDTEAVGVAIVTVRRVEGYSGGSNNLLKADDSKTGDLYVTLGWSKWGKPLWSTRIISGVDAVWEETTALLVGPSEINGQELLQLQVWDSDRFTVDDFMGNVELSLRDLMSSNLSLNHMSVRQDRLVGERGEPRSGALHWECGYFEKTTFEQHVERKHQDAEEVRSKIEKEAEDKLREAKARGPQTEDAEIEQQKKEDVKEKTDEIVATSRPTSEWPSGILSIKIEQITGLEIEKIKESGVREDAEEEDDADLPSSYCTIILNEQRVYKTRTKMKSNNPFFAAGTEKFVRDWRTTDVIISVHDSRLHEVDPVIGIVVLPLRNLFKHRSECTDSFPLVGGIGYGRMRLSLIFRSVQLRLPKRLLGWDVGTLEILSDIKPSSDFPQRYSSCRVSIHTPYGKSKMIPNHADGGWSSKKGKPIRLAVKKRYASCLVLQLRQHAVGADPSPAFATLWFKEIPDNEALKLSLPVYENTGGALKDAQKNAVAGYTQQIGTFNLTVRFWPGLSGYHKILADHDKNMADVMEVLDYVEIIQAKSQSQTSLHEPARNDDESVSSSESSDEGGDDKNASRPDSLSMNVEPSGQFKDFRKHQGELHRKHRGLMQWKAMRNVAWIGRGLEHKASKITDSVKGTFKHQSYEAGLEKEVQ